MGEIDSDHVGSPELTLKHVPIYWGSCEVAL
jgi:hypothetical protein